MNGCKRVGHIAAIGLLAVALAGCVDDDAGTVAVGTLERDRIELIAEASEPIVRIEAREGDPLDAEQVVLRLDDVRFRAEQARAEAARDRAAARLAELVRGPRRERVEEARAALAAAESAVETERREWQRARELARTGVAADAELDRAEHRRAEARARHEQARAALEALIEGTTVEELDQARAALAEAQAAVAEIGVRMDRLVVRSPQNGRLDAVLYERGERPAPGGVVAVMLADRAPYARVYVPEHLRAHVVAGGHAEVRIDGVEESFAGRVRRVAHEASFTPFFALTERDRGRLVYVAEIDLLDEAAEELPTGVPVEAVFDEAGEANGRAQESAS